MAENFLEYNIVLDELLQQGYTYDLKVEGSQVRIGKGVSSVELFILYDPDGRNVTSLYNVIYEEGVLEVKGATIKIYVFQQSWEYTSKNFSYNNDEYLEISVPKGLKLVISKIKISLTDAGVITSSMVNSNIEHYFEYAVYDLETGEDVTEEYGLAVVNYGTEDDYDVLTVRPRQFEITTASASKRYDGIALKYNSFYVSKGYLATGHKISIRIVGEQTEPGKSNNNFITGGNDSYMFGNGNWFVYDANGNDVTHNYMMVNYVLGTLEVTE
jgi:hypothetical protein